MNGLHKCFRYWIKKDIQVIGLNIYLSGWIEKYFCDSIEYEVMVIEFNTSFCNWIEWIFSHGWIEPSNIELN